MSILGVVHLGFGMLAILLGGTIFRITKGTQLHRLLGYGYVVTMLGLNITALAIYRVFGVFGPFHVLAIVSLATLVAGFVPVYFKWPREDWLLWHYNGMCWSYVGLLAATAAEIAVRLPFGDGFGFVFGLAVFVSSLIVVGIGASVLNRYRDQILDRFKRPLEKPVKTLPLTEATGHSSSKAHQAS